MQANYGLRCHHRSLGSLEALILLSLICLGGTILSFSVLFNKATDSEGRHGYDDNQGEDDPSPWANGALSMSKPIKVANCPMQPEEGYPQEYHMTKIVSNWNPDLGSSFIPPFHHDSLCRFDYQNPTQLDQAYKYREAEVPFVIHNIPELNKEVESWKDLSYVKSLIHQGMHTCSISVDEHFMFYDESIPNPYLAWIPFLGPYLAKVTDSMALNLNHWVFRIVRATAPSWLQSVVNPFFTGQLSRPLPRHIRMPFDTWLDGLIAGGGGHQYLTVNVPHNSTLATKMPIFKTFLAKPAAGHDDKENTAPAKMSCRFAIGPHPIVAEPHFDLPHNFIAVLGGSRRWLLAHPRHCVNMHLFPAMHKLSRHSPMDWSHPDLGRFPRFANLTGSEVILHPGDALIVPSSWIHEVVTLGQGVQCNMFTGQLSEKFLDELEQCGILKRLS